MQLLTVIGLFLDLVGIVILGSGEVMKDAASLRSLKESYKDSFEYDVQQRPWYIKLLPGWVPHSGLAQSRCSASHHLIESFLIRAYLAALTVHWDLKAKLESKVR